MNKCTFGQDKTNFLGKTISRQQIAPLTDKIDKFLNNLKVPTSMKSLERYLEFVNFYRQYIAGLAEKLIPLYRLLQKDVKFQLTQVQKDAIIDINENLAKTAKLSLRLLLPDQQLVIMCDASQHRAG